MICVAVKGDPVIGVVHFPFSKQTYWAWIDNVKSENLKGVKSVSIMNSMFLLIFIESRFKFKLQF